MARTRRLFLLTALALLVPILTFVISSGGAGGRSSVVVTVEDDGDGRSLAGLVVEASYYPASDQDSGALAETDENGEAFFESLRPGSVTFRVGLPGFRDFFQTVTLRRADNKEIVFSLDVATVDVRGRVLDEESGLPVGGAAVVLGGASGRTDEEGWFLLDDAIIGTPFIKIRKDGYESFSNSV
jgi:protocatechuate 3,4-dioxygenase beta subunit